MEMESTRTSRSRLSLSISVIAIIALGLASRKYPLFPAVLEKYPGDALWALMVFAGLAFLMPRASTMRLAATAYIIACAVEFSQLYQAPWINSIRETTLGRLVLGSSFTWVDIAAYGFGVLLGAVADFASHLIQIATGVERQHRIEAFDVSLPAAGSPVCRNKAARTNKAR